MLSMNKIYLIDIFTFSWMGPHSQVDLCLPRSCLPSSGELDANEGRVTRGTEVLAKEGAAATEEGGGPASGEEVYPRDSRCVSCSQLAWSSMSMRNSILTQVLK